jgi:hypothetical protein
MVVLLPKETPALARWRCNRDHSGSSEIGSSGFATALIGLHVERKLLTLVEIVHAGALDCRDVNEHVWAGIILHNETKTLLGVEKLNGTCGHAMASL